MKKLAIILLAASMLLLVSCGSSKSNNVTGNWQASLTASQGSAAVPSFTAALAMDTSSSTDTNTYTMVTINSLTMSTNGGCFVNNPNETASYRTTETSNSFGLAVQGPGSAAMGDNVLILQGALSGDAITGTWMMSGLQSGCSGSGSFTMNRIPTPGPSRNGSLHMPRSPWNAYAAALASAF